MSARRRGVFVCSLLCLFLVGAFGASSASASNPVPYVDILSPVSVHPGSTNVTLTVNGTGFVSASVVEWNGTALTTTFVSPERLTAAVPDSLVAAVGLGSITVVNPTPGGRVSNVVYFPVASFEATTSFPSTPNSSLTVGTSPQGIITADFNSDGKLDLAVANSGSNTVSVLLGNGDGTFTLKSSPGAGTGSNWLVAGDFNEDGILDLAIANLSANTVSVLLGNGDGTFTLKSSPATGSQPFAIAAGDFNGDGHLDLAVSNSADGTVTVLLGDGTGSFTASSTPPVGSLPQVIVAGDFNEDGKLDLAVSNEGSDTVSVLLGIGNGTFQSQATVSVGGSGLPIGLIAADIEGTHHIDLMAVNASDVAILRGNGLGSFTLIGNPFTGTSDLIAGVVGDYNGDGKLDLVVSDRTAGKAFLLPGNGDGTFGAKLTFTTSAGSFGVATADFNGDGGLDLAVANGSAANVSIFLQGLPVSLFPTSIAFGNQNINTSSGAHVVTLKNSSGSSFRIASIDITGADNADFSNTTTCGATLANGATCTISVIFTPTTAGALTATLTITDTASNSPQTLALSGTGFSSAPSVTSANTVTFTVGTAGSFSVTTTATPTASLGESGTLPSGVTFVDNGNGTGTLSGTPGVGTGASYPITFTATNVGGSTPQSFTLIVDQAAAITSANSASFSVASAGSFVISATGNPTPLFGETGALPSGVTFLDNNNGTATLAGTPAGGTAGTYNITITAHNGVGSNATQLFALTVNQMSSFTGANNATFTVGSAGTFTVTASGSPTPTLSESGTLPSGLTFNPATGVLGGTPAPGTGGTYPITFTASNGVGSNATLNFTLTIDQASAISSGNSATFTTGAAGTFAVTATGFPAPTLSESGLLPSGVTFNGGTGVLSGTPAAGTGGNYSITFTAHNGVGSNAIQTFSFSVNQPASITSANHATFAAGSAGTVTVTATGFPAPVLSEGGALPSGVTFNAGTGVLSGTPAAGTGGSYPITFTAHNGVGADATQSFTLSVNQTSAITSAASATFAVGAAGSFTVTTTGSPAPTVSETGALPSGVTFNAGTGVLSGTPAAGTGGSYPITITASNGVGSNATQSFTITVNQSSSISSANHATFTAGSAGTFTVTATGSPAPVLSENGALPAGVTFNPATGVLSGTPAAGTGGTYSISFTASNGIGSSSTLGFTLTVDQAASITSPNTTSFAFAAASTFNVTTSGQPTPSLTETGALPAGISFVDNGNGTGVFAGTPGLGSGGTYNLTLTAHNGIGTNATVSFTLIVTKVTPTLTWSTPSAIGFGVALTAAQLDATSSVPGTFVYSPAAGTVLAAGSQSLSVTFTPTDAADYTTATASAILPVNKATPSVTWAPPSAVTYGTALGSAQLDASSAVAGTWTYTPPAGTVLNAGSQSLLVSFAPSNSTDYLPATAQVLLVVNPAPTTTTLSASPNPADGGASVTLTASVASVAGIPSGIVTFFDGSTPLGTVALTAGGAKFTTSTLTLGSHSIKGAYSGSANFTASTSAALPETVVRADFNVASAANSAVIQSGQPLSVPITVTPEGGFTGQIHFALSGLPAGATAVFSPAILTLGASPAKETLTITTTPRFPYLSRAIPKSPGVFAAALWFPLAGLLAGGAGVIRRNRNFWLCLACIAISSVVMGGCASAGNFQNTGTAAGTYNLVITASSASTTHTMTVTLRVE